jgi:5-methylcytosine-specific restriction endonuclease McrA
MAASSEKREAFYHSPEWRKCQAAFKREKHFTCEMCGKAGWLVHHKVPLDDENVDNPNIALGFDNLMLLCPSCHDAIHHRLKGHGRPNVQHHKVKFDKNGNVVVEDK